MGRSSAASRRRRSGSAVTGGRYQFQGTVPPMSAAYETRAFYEWMPDEKTGGEDER
jgi:hypothetical protein